MPIFIQSNKDKKDFTVTHSDMTRFNLTLEEGVNFVDWCFLNNLGGEILYLS